MEKGHPFYKYFTDQIYAIAIPASMLVAVIVFVGIFIAVMLLKEISKAKTS